MSFGQEREYGIDVKVESVGGRPQMALGRYRDGPFDKVAHEVTRGRAGRFIDHAGV